MILKKKPVQRAKKTLSFYIAVGKVYREFLAKTGFENETKNIFEEYKNSGLKSIHELVSDSMLNHYVLQEHPKKEKNNYKNLEIQELIYQLFNLIQ